LSQRLSALCIAPSSDGVRFFIHVTPRARTERVGPCHGDALRVSVSAPPVQGRANAACVKLLARELGVTQAAVEIDPGARSRRKRVFVGGDPDDLAGRLQMLAQESGLR
jgi:hypothetical protein